MKDFSASWVDLLIVGLVIFGITRGRRRGMSEEFLDLVKWLCIVLGAGLLHQPVGQFLAETTFFSTLFCYVSMYVLIALVITLFFSMLRSAVGAKLVGSDAFGNGEYYLGMTAGALRYSCMILAAMALLNARLYSPEEVAAEIRYQQENFGDIRFPTLGELQRTVFQEGVMGRGARAYLPFVLIPQTAPEQKGLGPRNNVVRARERDVRNIVP